MSTVAKSSSSLALASRTEQSVVIITAEGVLDASHSAELRDCITKATLDVPAAVIVDVSSLDVADDAAWSLFVSARWQLDTRPDVPIVLVSANRATRDAIARSGVADFMPVFPTEKGAMKAVARLGRRKLQHSQTKLTANVTSLRESRQLVREWLTNWSKPGLIPVALVVVNVFIENVLEHTGSDPVMRIECEGQTATIAVSDSSTAPAVRLASPPKGVDVSGLAIVDALSRTWGSTPTSSGKTVWAVIGPENQL
ncbi:STAS domain-containing protein [Mycobacterium asiaticum]|uniref:Sulfate transporter n=1 Tax=Mycobacterium asiaticum TaxID=1790 RepID=A0A1A3MP66_MYCAS|nr:STAS domain-containing protein [Mycobacterium asiaticum]OBK11738.1 sulfate transporter [Mycobacterium asiaticum]